MKYNTFSKVDIKSIEGYGFCPICSKKYTGIHRHGKPEVIPNKYHVHQTHISYFYKRLEEKEQYMKKLMSRSCEDTQVLVDIIVTSDIMVSL